MVAVLIAVCVSGLAGYALYYINSHTLLVCPGCNPPETLFLDHYNIQNNTNGKPSLLTVWMRSTGPAGKQLTLVDLAVFDGPTEFSFTVTGVIIPALSIVPATVDTSSQGFYFSSGKEYSIGIITDQGTFGGIMVTYPSETLVLDSYEFGNASQSSTTNLTIWLDNRGVSSASLAALTLKSAAATNSTLYTFPMTGPTIDQPGASARVDLNTNSTSLHFVHQQYYWLTIDPSIGPASTSLLFFQ